jgi:hypothetical protein
VLCAVVDVGCFWDEERLLCYKGLVSVVCGFLGMVLTYFLNDFEMVPVALIITSITLIIIIIIL